MGNITRIETDMTDALKEGEIGIAVLCNWTDAYGNVKRKVTRDYV